MKHLNIVILAAGKGKRMYSARPKVLHPIGGKPMLQRVIDTAKRLMPSRLIIVYGHGKEHVREAVASPDSVWIEQTEQWGTGHALKVALPALVMESTTLVLYGDVPLIQSDTLSALLAAAGEGMAVLTNVTDEPAGYGRIVRGGDGNVLAIVEEKECTPAQCLIHEINTGIMALPTDYLAGWLGALNNHNAQKEYYLTDVVAFAVRDRIPVAAIAVSDAHEADGVNSKVQLARLERAWQRRQAYALLDAGVTLADPERIDIRGELRCGQDVSIDVNCIFEGDVELGDGVTVGPHCLLKDVKVAAGAMIAAFSLLEGAHIGAESRIGPYARLRPGTQVLSHAHVGNFVEVKNSRIGSESKVNHLTYIGDATIGQKVNVGAGCVTVNYNGVEKFQTTIEDDVFVGSGTMMVAPVTLQQGATVGAGSVITQMVPAGKLSIARARQVLVPGWQRPKK